MWWWDDVYCLLGLAGAFCWKRPPGDLKDAKMICGAKGNCFSGENSLWLVSMSNAFCVKPSPLIHCGYESNFMIFDRLIRLTFSLLNNSNSTVSLHLCLFVLLSENHCASLFISCGITHCSLYLSIVSASGIPPKVTWPLVASSHGSISQGASAEMEVSVLAQSDGSHPRRVTRNQSD